MRTNDSTIKLIDSGIRSKYLTYVMRPGELCMVMPATPADAPYTKDLSKQSGGN